MHKQLSFLNLIFIALITLVLTPVVAHAEIYKQVDSEGRVTYSNVKLKGAKKLDLEPADTNFGGDSSAKIRSEKRVPQAKIATPGNFPKVDSGTQTQRDSKRKDILLSELEAEKQALAQAKQAYIEGESKPEVYQGAGGKTFRNVAKFDEKMKGLQADIDVHQRNIELLNKEINAN